MTNATHTNRPRTTMPFLITLCLNSIALHWTPELEVGSTTPSLRFRAHKGDNSWLAGLPETDPLPILASHPCMDKNRCTMAAAFGVKKKIPV
jgi:hypothetical protein